MDNQAAQQIRDEIERHQAFLRTVIPPQDVASRLVDDQLRRRIDDLQTVLAGGTTNERVEATVSDHHTHIYVSSERMRQARASLGSPGALDEALVATGIDAFFVLLDGGTVEIDGRVVELKEVGDDEMSDPIRVERVEWACPWCDKTWPQKPSVWAHMLKCTWRGKTVWGSPEDKR